jgi:sulfide:quinone oxidoreductase
MKEPKILILGGGFAGLEAAIKLRKYGYPVTLISNRNYMFIYPTSIWIPVGKQSFDDTKLDLHELSKLHGFELIVENIKKIDIDNQKIITDKTDYSYEYLFIALGMGKKYIKGLEHTLSICGAPEQSLLIKEKLENLITKGEGQINIGFGGNPDDPTATAVRGGPAFELLFNISLYLKEKGLRDKIKLNFFSPSITPGKKMGKKAFANLDKFYKRYHINTFFGKPIKAFEPNSIVFKDGSELPSDLTVYISGGQGLDIIQQSGLPVNKAGFIEINELTRVEGHRNIYAIGDAAAIIDHPWAAKQGHIAEVMADVSTYNFNNTFKQKDKRKSYWEKLHIICVMDSGDAAAFVIRTQKNEWMISLPIIGHWMKKMWGWYYKNTKKKKMFRLPGM